MSPEQLKRQARRLAEEVWTQGDLAVADALIAHDDDPSATPRERTGLAGLKDRVTALRRAFPDLHLLVEDQIVDADRVVTRSTARGTHTGALLGRAPSGRRVEFELIEISRVGDDGRITQHWTALDTHDLLQQLDAPPADTAA